MRALKKDVWVGRKNTNINVNKTCVATLFGIKIQLTDDEVFTVSPGRENKYDSLKSPKVFSHIHILSLLGLIC